MWQPGIWPRSAFASSTVKTGGCSVVEVAIPSSLRRRNRSWGVAAMPLLLHLAGPCAINPDPGRGRSSGVEHNLAKVGVEGSNPFARSRLPRYFRELHSRPRLPAHPVSWGKQQVSSGHIFGRRKDSTLADIRVRKSAWFQEN